MGTTDHTNFAERTTRRLALWLDAGEFRWVCTFWRIASFGGILGALIFTGLTGAAYALLR